MHGRAYYNEFDPGAAAWLRELVRTGLIADGDVDERSIVDVQPEDVRGYTQCHLFAGVGGWSLALRLAGWPDGREVWTGSCPCQPFSDAGDQKGEADARHLWPYLHHLVETERPAKLFGEQVASKLGREWLAGVRADLEELGYEVGAADLCAASVGAPHIRQRLWFVADAGCNGLDPRCRSRSGVEAPERGEPIHNLEPDGGSGGMANAECERARPGIAGSERRSGQWRDRPAINGAPVRLGDTIGPRLERLAGDGDDGNQPGRHEPRPTGSVAATSAIGFWRDFESIPCRDSKARRIEPGTFPLAHGIPGRVGRLRGYGNAIVPQVAAAFIQAYLEARGER